MSEWKEPHNLPGMKTFCCSYTGTDGHRYCINLPGTTFEQLEEDQADALPCFRVDGVLVATMEATK